MNIVFATMQSAPTGLAPDELPLAAAKLAAPRQRPGSLVRQRIMRALDAGHDAALTLVAAPAGYGKTTAVRTWCAERGCALAWVTLDAGDNDPVRLWTYIATAVERVRPGLGHRALQRLRFVGGAVEAAVDEVMNGIAAVDGLLLVLDDLHTVTDGECLASLEYAIEHLPETGRLVVSTRIDPALPLAGLRARGALAELRADELAFTTQEAHELVVEGGGVRLDPDDLDLLVRRTEGWPAALFLARLWLSSVPDPRPAVREFGASHRFVAEFLSQEVFASFDPEVRSFVLRASVLGRFTAELCDAALERSGSASLLAELERSNLLLTRLEGSAWFRVHALLAEFARFELAAADPGAADAIHRRAAAWLREHGMPAEAAEQAAAVDDHAFIAELLAEHYLRLLRSGNARTLLRWAGALPESELAARPQLAAGAATAAATVGRRAIERRRYLSLIDRAERAAPGTLGPLVYATAGLVRSASVDDDVGGAVREGRRAVEIALAAADDAVVAALAAYARALYLAGDLDDAWAAGLRAVEHPDAERRAPGQAFARSTLALVAAERGELANARVHAEKAKALVGRVGTSRSWIGANAAVALGAVLAAEGKLADAERELAYAEYFFGDEIATVQHAWLLVLRAGVQCRRGHLAEAQATLAAARRELDAFDDSGRVRRLLEAAANDLQELEARALGGEVVDPPTDAEVAVLRLLPTDLTTRQIGAKLFLSPNTVRSHTRAVYRKLGVKSRADAVARAAALGLFEQTQSPM